MIETSEYWKYDTDGHFYYLTEAGAVFYTGYDDLTMLWNNPAQRLKTQGRILHQEYTKSAYNVNKPRYTNKDNIEYAVFKNANGEVDAIIRALINFVEAVWDSELDREVLNGERVLPQFTIQPLIDCGVYTRGKIIGIVPEDEYQVGY